MSARAARRGRGHLAVGVAAVLLCLAAPARGEEGDDPAPEPEVEKKADKTTWNEYDGRLVSLRVGGGLLFDYVYDSQDDDAEVQMPLDRTSKLRDFRFVFSGHLKGLSSHLRYTLGYMYDDARDSWRFRQTGLILELPVLAGYLFVGRTKEGFSTSKFTMGYNLWTHERSPANDAFLPILADGARWTGTGFGGHLVYNVGAFIETLTPDESYRKSDKQAAARVVWLPFAEDDDRGVLHLAVEGRVADSLDGAVQYRSKPEAFPAQSFAVDTGEFAADGSAMLGLEAYYTTGSLVVGSEYFLNQVYSDDADDPFFHGGEAFAAWLFCGEKRPYKGNGAYFGPVSPSDPVGTGGPGAWELVLRFSYIDLDSGPIEGGTFWRVTPMLNWYLSDQARLEVIYGYSVLDRFSVKGETQFLQTRLQLQLP